MQKLRGLFVISFSFVMSCIPSLSQAEQCEIRNDSVQIYISDSHIGTGGRCEGQGCRDGWHNMEDFRWHDDFRQFISFLEGKISKPIDLVMVGDSFELWQDMAAIPCKDDGQRSNFGCNAEQAKKRVEKVGEKHGEVFQILSDFVGPDKDNKIIMLPGNHDAALAINSVADTVKEQFTEASRDNVCVDEDGMIFANGIFVEHGHQLEGDMNRYDEPLNGTIECINSAGKAVNCNDNDAFVRRSWGENFVQNYFNKYEDLFPVIDNYATEGAGVPDGVERGFKASSLPKKSSAVLGFLSFFFTKQTLAHLGDVLSTEQEGVTTICRDENDKKCLDLKTMGEWPIKHKIFSQLPDEDKETLELIFDTENNPDAKLRDIYAQYAPEDASKLDTLLIATCLYWAQKDGDVRCAYDKETLGTSGTKIKQWIKGVIDSDYDNIVEHINHREKQFTDEFKYFIYGHTHFAEQRKTNDKTIINTGAWQRVTDPDAIEKTIQKCTASGINEKDCFKTMTPDKLTPCYSFAASELGSYTTPTLFWWFLVPGSEDEFGWAKNGNQPSSCKFQR